MDKRKTQEAQWRPVYQTSASRSTDTEKVDAVKPTRRDHVRERPSTSDETRRITRRGRYIASQIQSDVQRHLRSRVHAPKPHHLSHDATPVQQTAYQDSPTDSIATTTITTTTNTTVPSHEQEIRVPLLEMLPTNRPFYGRTVVELCKGGEANLGLAIADRTDTAPVPTIANIQSGSIADRSDRLLIGDRLLAIENLYGRCSDDSSKATKRTSNQWIRLEIEYQLPELPPAACMVKHMKINLEPKGEGIGLVLRGGWSCLPSHNRPLTVMSIRTGSLADCDGRIKPGDRIVAINDVQTGKLACDEAIKLIETSKRPVSLLVEYNVANFETDRNASEAVMVEIEKPHNEDLGISLAPCHEIKTGQNAFFINFVEQGSIADRCGALFAGDRVEAIDDIRVEDLTLQEAMRRLKNNGTDRIRLQIVPNAVTDLDHPTRAESISSKKIPRSKSNLQSTSDYAWESQQRQPLIRSQPSSRTRETTSSPHDPKEHGYTTVELSQLDQPLIKIGGLNLKQHNLNKSLTSIHSVGLTRSEICRCEEVEVCLEPDETGSYGFSLGIPERGGLHEAQLIRFPVVQNLVIGGPAFKSGVMQEGDRVITINGQSTLNRHLDELNKLINSSLQDTWRFHSKLTLVVQYSVADTVVPAAGVFDVRLARRTANLGINLQASIKKHDGQPLLISKVIPGSVASRSGSINPGDILIAVNGVHLSSCSLAEAISLLQSQADEIVTLRVKKIDSGESNRTSEEIVCRIDSNFAKYHRDDSIPQSEPIPSTSRAAVTRKIKCHTGPNTPEVEQDEGFVVLSRSADLRSDEPRISSTHSDISMKGLRKNVEELKETIKFDSNVDPGIFTTEQSYTNKTEAKDHAVHLSDERRCLFSSPEDLSQNESVSIIRVVLKRQSPELPWGIIICGTDEESNAPVFIDSLSPGEPGAMSGLLCAGDRILAINGNALNAGHTLTQAMRMLQHYPDKVVLHVARTNPDRTATNVERLSGTTQDALEKDSEPSGQRPPLKKVGASINFSRSFDSATTSASSAGGMYESSNSRQTVVTCGQQLGTQGSRPRSTTSVLTLPANFSDETFLGGIRPTDSNLISTSFKTTDTTVLQIDQRTPLTTKDNRTVEESLTTSTSFSIKPGQTKLSQAKSKLADRPDYQLNRLSSTTQEPSARYTDESSSDFLGKTSKDFSEYPQYSASYPEYTEADLEAIQCPGCREAIINELRQRQEKLKLLRASNVDHRRYSGDKSKSTRHKPHSRRRTKSDPRSTDGTTSQQTSYHRNLPANTCRQNVHEEQPKAIFFCPEQELCDGCWITDFHYSHLLSPQGKSTNVINRYSKSDSRVNLTGIEQEEFPGHVSTVIDSKTLATRPIMKLIETGIYRNTPTAETSNIPESAPSKTSSHTERRIHQQSLKHQRSDPSGQDSSVPLFDQTVRNPPGQRANRKSHEQDKGGVWCKWIRLAKTSVSDSYGIGVSEGLSTRGIFVSAIRPNSPADISGQLHLYDRILMVNDQDTDGLSCSEVVGLISRSERSLDLLIQRRISRTKRPQMGHGGTNPGTMDQRSRGTFGTKPSQKTVANISII